MSKEAVYQKELEKLTEIFANIEESKRQLVEGLIEDAAFIKAENFIIKQSLAKTGMVKVHPIQLELQKPIESAKQYLKNINSYSVVIKTLNGVLNANMIEEEDELSEYE